MDQDEGAELVPDQDGSNPPDSDADDAPFSSAWNVLGDEERRLRSGTDEERRAVRLRRAARAAEMARQGRHVKRHYGVK